MDSNENYLYADGYFKRRVSHKSRIRVHFLRLIATHIQNTETKNTICNKNNDLWGNKWDICYRIADSIVRKINKIKS